MAERLRAHDLPLSLRRRGRQRADLVRLQACWRVQLGARDRQGQEPERPR